MGRDFSRMALRSYIITGLILVSGMVLLLINVAVQAPSWAWALGYSIIILSVFAQIIMRFIFPSSKVTGYEDLTKRIEKKTERFKNSLK